MINAALEKQPTIGSGGFYVSLTDDDLANFDLTDATIWAEIRILDRFDNVLFHGVKESETLEEAMARASTRPMPSSDDVQNPQGNGDQ